MSRRWTQQDLDAYERRNHRVHNQECPVAKLELPEQSRPLGTPPRKKVGVQKNLVIYTDFRTRLCDEDNLCSKYRTDALRKYGLIDDDRPQLTSIVTRQVYVPTKAEEETKVRIIKYCEGDVPDMALVAEELVPGPTDRPLVYLACPYIDKQGLGREYDRFNAVTKAAAELSRQGLVVFSPITHSHPMAMYGLPKDWAFWQRVDYAYLRCSRQLRVLTLDGWKDSVGVRAEMEFAFANNIPVELMEPVA